MPSQFDTNLLPASTTTYDVGSTSQQWRKVYADNVTANSLTLPASYSNGVSVFNYGAVGDGVTDDSAAFNACAAANTVILVPGGYTYALTASTVNILAGQTWICNGATFTQASSSKTMFAATTVNDWSFYGGKLTGSGNGAAGSGTNEILFKVTDGLRFRVNNVTCNNSQGWGFKRISANAPAYRGEGGQYVNCSSIGCWNSNEITAGSGSEYSTWVNFQSVNHGTGAQIGAGNTTFLGGSCSDGVYGVVLAGGANHGHGIVSGMNINHNTTDNVLVSTITNGFTFAGCHLYANSSTTGWIHLSASNGVEFIGCMIDSNIKNDSANGSNNFFLSNYMVSNTATAAPAGSSTTTNLVLSGNTIPTGNGWWAYNNSFDVGNGTISAGTRAAGMSIGDISASRTATTGAVPLGSDGNKYLARLTDQLQFGGFTSLAPASAALSSLGTAALPFSALTVNQEVTPRSNVAVVNGANADVNIGANTFIKLTGPTGVFSISGFTGGLDGRKLVAYNSVAFAWTITNNATSTAANRILTLTGADVTLRAGQSSATFIYDSAQSLWILVSTN